MEGEAQQRQRFQEQGTAKFEQPLDHELWRTGHRHESVLAVGGGRLC